MKITSDQIRAARALLHLGQTEVARRAGVSPVTLRRLEAGSGVVGEATLTGVASALEDAGVEFVERGVRRRERTAGEVEETLRVMRDIVDRSAPALKDLPAFSDHDLYGDDGLPT